MSTRHRSVRLAVLGSAVQRAASPKYPSRSNPALRRRAVLGVLLALSLVLITLYFRDPESGGLHAARSGGATVLKPFQVGAERVVRPFRDAYGYFADLVGAKEENEELKEELREVRQEAIQSRVLFEENRTLRELLGYVSSPSFPQDFGSVAAAVTAYPPSQFEQKVAIAAGAEDGIRVNDPVVNAEGLVGKVTDVTDESAEVTLLTDEEIAVSALDIDTDATGLVQHGRAGEDSLVMDLVAKRYVVEEGDDVVTAGSQRGQLGSIYPRGIHIGTVTSVGQTDTDLYKRIQIQPAVDFGSLDAVLVLVPKRERR